MVVSALRNSSITRKLGSLQEKDSRLFQKYGAFIKALHPDEVTTIKRVYLIDLNNTVDAARCRRLICGEKKLFIIMPTKLSDSDKAKCTERGLERLLDENPTLFDGLVKRIRALSQKEMRIVLKYVPLATSRAALYEHIHDNGESVHPRFVICG